VSWGWAESPTVFLSRAEEMANKALSLNDADVRARIVLGRIHIFYKRYELAKVEMDRAIAVNPSDAHGLAGRGNVLMWLGQTDAAIEALELALPERAVHCGDRAGRTQHPQVGRCPLQPCRARGSLCAAKPVRGRRSRGVRYSPRGPDVRSGGIRKQVPELGRS
jgi:hypothetical protein